MSSLKATPQLMRLCEHVAPDPEVQRAMAGQPDMCVRINEDTLEQRWRGKQDGGAPGAALPTVSHPKDALAIQLNRAKVACASARRNLIVAERSDKLLLNGMFTCRQDLATLAEACQALAESPPSDPAWHALLDDAYHVGKAMDGAMQRLRLKSCMTVGLDVMSQSRGLFEAHEIYALAALLEHVEHAPPCTEIRQMVREAFRRTCKERAKDGNGTGELPLDDQDIMTRLTTDEKLALNAFLAHPMVHAVLTEAHRLYQDELDARSSGGAEYALTDLAQRAKRNSVSPQVQALMGMMQRHRQLQDMLTAKAYGVIRGELSRSAPVKQTHVDRFFKTSKGRALSQEWDASAQELCELLIQPSDRARHMQANSLRARLEAMFVGPEIMDVEILFADPFHVPEGLHADTRALMQQAKQHVLSPGVQSSLTAFAGDVSTILEEATSSDSIAMEMRFVLDTRTQAKLRALRKRLDSLTSTIARRPMQKTAKHRRTRSVADSASPTSVLASPGTGTDSPSSAHASASSASLGDEWLSKDSLDADEVFAVDELAEEASPTAALASPSAPQAAASQGGLAPIRNLRVNGSSTPLRTRLSNGEALALIDEHMAQGTFSSPLRSAIYHFRRHVRCEIGIDAEDPQAVARAQAKAAELQDVTIEDYLDEALQRFADWDGHTVTHARSSGELLALVEGRPRGWFTREGKVVSFCYEDG